LITPPRFPALILIRAHCPGCFRTSPLPAKARYDRGEFVHSNAPGVTGGGVLDNGSYGETFIPERFAREALGGILPLFEFHVGEGHPILFFEKPDQMR
jgi:hypothetical protein